MEDVRELKELLEIKVKAEFLVEVITSCITKYRNSNTVYIANDDTVLNALKVTYPEQLEKRLKELNAELGED